MCLPFPSTHHPHAHPPIPDNTQALARSHTLVAALCYSSRRDGNAVDKPPADGAPVVAFVPWRGASVVTVR
jgi:hypothetical protein